LSPWGFVLDYLSEILHLYLAILGGIATIPIDTESAVVLQKGSKGMLPCREEGNLTLINNVAWYKGSFDDLPIIQAGYYKGSWEKGGYDKKLYDIHENFSLIIKNVETTDHGSFFCSANILEPRSFLTSQVNVSVFGKLYFRL